MTDNVPQREDEILLEEAHRYASELAEMFLNRIAAPFQHAAVQLEYEKVLRSHLRYCHTHLGKSRLVEELAPKTHLRELSSLLAEIAEMRALLVHDDAPSFAAIYDIGPILHKIEIAGSSLYLDEGAKVVGTLRGMRILREYVARRAEVAPELWSVGVYLFDDRLLEMHFDSVFDRMGAVRDSASTELQRIRSEIIHASEHLRARLGSILRRLSDDGFVQEDLITQREGRYVVPVKLEHKRRVPGFIHSVSQSGQTVFVEPSETLELNNELRSLAFAEQREIERILKVLAEELRVAAPGLHRSLLATARIEAIYAKARYAEEIQSNPVRLTEQRTKQPRRLAITGARHLLLLGKLGRERTVALNLELDETRRTLVLTGPNAGGKTVLLKTLGLVVLMAQAGLPIPADPDGELPLVDGVYVEIGDSQSIADDLSTFSSHVTALARIMSDATRSSLVLLDEIGGGTAPEEGGAIAESVLESLTRIGALTIVTTHYGRLAAFAETTDSVINGSMEFDRTTLMPTFHFRMGVPGSSHAFEIAERFGLGRKIVERAKALRGEAGRRLEELIRTLEDLQREARERRILADKELGGARIAKLEYERKRDEVEDIRRKAKATAVREAERILHDANAFIERAVRDAKEAAVAEATGSKGRTSLKSGSDLKALRAAQEAERKKLLATVAPIVEAGAKTKEKIGVGSFVQLKTNRGSAGKVVSIEGKDVELTVGGLKVRTKLSNLELASEKESVKQSGPRVSEATKFLAASMEPRIDVRGLYGDEAVAEVERFVADASARGLYRLEIVHGVGTGVLGKRIDALLAKSSVVATYRYGEPQEGGAGVTIVELK